MKQSMAEQLTKKELIEILGKCWMTHDGMWFYNTFMEYGMESANRINKAAIKSLAPIEIHRLKKTDGNCVPYHPMTNVRTFSPGSRN